jgi:RNA polymerase sigma factor (TIGR02999 family)
LATNPAAGNEGVMGESVTELLIKWGGGEAAALDRLMPLVYQDLRRLARACLRDERQHHTLQPTALVHEVYLRLIDDRQVDWQHRAQFFGLAAKMMRNILVDHSRRKGADKRGGDNLRVSLSAVDQQAKGPDVDIIAIDDALKSLASFKPVHAQVVELRYFGGLTIEQTAEVLDLSHATVERYWNFARAWLHRELAKREVTAVSGPL